MFKEIQGDLLELFTDGQFDVIAHGCNCFCTMNSGIAKQIRERWPIVYEIDCKTQKADFNKLGNYSVTSIFRNISYGEIYNLYTQYNYGYDNQIYLQYCALQLALEKMLYAKQEDTKCKIGLPRIGCGKAGGDWNIVKEIIEDLVDQYNADVTIVTYDKD